MKVQVNDRYRYRRYFAAVKGRAANVEALLKRVASSYRKIDLPLVMISQVERSGGSMMAQLFDGHPQILAHPHELKIGYPDKRIWPPTDIANIDEQFRVLFELNTINFFEEGYFKGKHNPQRINFFLMPQLQRAIFEAELAGREKRTGRDVLDAYFTSYFNAWLNLRNRIEDAKLITGFVPMMAADESNMDQFWSVYPDGYLISVIRSPLSWYPSFVKLKGGTVETVAARWNSSTEGTIRERARRKDRTIVLRFDDVVKNTEAAMRLVCRRIGLDFHPSLVSPTFNQEPIGSNSVFGQTEPGVVTAAPAQRESLLSDAERDYLNAHCMPLYKRALDEIVETV
ncbi:MAG: sulfotransferase [Pseudorhodoplanes sp.]|nr:sulfotransferase [Pseudorhodoplanes sp.]